MLGFALERENILAQGGNWIEEETGRRRVDIDMLIRVTGQNMQEFQANGVCLLLEAGSCHLL